MCAWKSISQNERCISHQQCVTAIWLAQNKMHDCLWKIVPHHHWRKCVSWLRRSTIANKCQRVFTLEIKLKCNLGASKLPFLTVITVRLRAYHTQQSLCKKKEEKKKEARKVWDEDADHFNRKWKKRNRWWE